MPGPTTKPLAFSVAIAAGVLLIAASAFASGTRITQGDAQAVFEANNAATAIRLHTGQVQGPAQGGASDGVRINAFIPWEGRHYCELDWHVISINLNDGNLPGESRTPSEIAAALSAIQVAYFLDGTALQLERTPVKPNLDPGALGFVNGFLFTSGRLMAPEDLTVGQHTLRIVITDPGGPIDDSQITFFVDAAGTGACL